MFYFAVVKQSAYGVYPDTAFAIASSIFRTNLGVQLLVHTYGPTLCDNHPGARSCCLYIKIQQADAVHSVVRQRTRHSCILHEHDRTRIIRSYAASKLFGYFSCARKMPRRTCLVLSCRRRRGRNLFGRGLRLIYVGRPVYATKVATAAAAVAADATAVVAAAAAAAVDAPID